jgi:hypothetical protein
MPDEQRPLFLLGPQTDFAAANEAIERLGLQSPVALITAGWETDEQFDHKIRRAIRVETLNLGLFARSEQLFADDPELIETLRARQDELRHLRDAYNIRLNLLLKAAREMIRLRNSIIDLVPERESAIEMVRQLDRQNFVRTSQIIDHYEDRLRTAERPLVVQHRREIGEMLGLVNGILIAGGHVAIILNRLKIFGILEMRRELPIIAWSGGTMALADQVVFFHDTPPQGPGDAEVLRAGMGLFHDVLPLPDANARLKLDDQARVELFAKRFDRYRCVLLDEQTILERRNGSWENHRPHGTRCLGGSGTVVEVEL